MASFIVGLFTGALIAIVALAVLAIVKNSKSKAERKNLNTQWKEQSKGYK